MEVGGAVREAIGLTRSASLVLLLFLGALLVARGLSYHPAQIDLVEIEPRPWTGWYAEEVRARRYAWVVMGGTLLVLGAVSGVARRRLYIASMCVCVMMGLGSFYALRTRGVPWPEHPDGLFAAMHAIPTMELILGAPAAGVIGLVLNRKRTD